MRRFLPVLVLMPPGAPWNSSSGCKLRRRMPRFALMAFLAASAMTQLAGCGSPGDTGITFPPPPPPIRLPTPSPPVLPPQPPLHIPLPPQPPLPPSLR
jgi:hypothetical protein